MSRVSVSEAQLALLEGRRSSNGSARQQRPQKRRDELPENQVAAQIVSFLQHSGWTVTRQHVGVFSRPFDPSSRVHIGEKGMTDWRAEKVIHGLVDDRRRANPHYLMYVEIKAPGKKPTPAQLLWMERRRMCGTPAGWFSDFDRFLAWYRSLGF